MKVFISYKFEGEDKDKLKEFMINVKKSLAKNNHNILTTFFDEEEFQKNNSTRREIMDKALSYINNSDKTICIIKSDRPSQGINFEIGYAVAKNKEIMLFIQEDLETRWIEHYAKIIKFKDLNDLYIKLENLK